MSRLKAVSVWDVRPLQSITLEWVARFACNIDVDQDWTRDSYEIQIAIIARLKLFAKSSVSSAMLCHVRSSVTVESEFDIALLGTCSSIQY